MVSSSGKRELPAYPAGRDLEHRLIGKSPAMRKFFGYLDVVGKSDVTVLLEGETGVGKNHVARLLHELSPRLERPFVSFNAATLPQELFESELFGHVKGAFSGAYDHHKGLARTADKGTLFIDEVGELSLPNQAKLLSFLDSQQVRPVGGVKATAVDLRLLAASNRDLKEQVRSGAFRRDLFYRLRVFPLRIPSLRERPEDIPNLVEHFVAELSGKHGKRVNGVTVEALESLRARRWEGNIRELRNEIERAVILTPEGGEIRPEILSPPDEDDLLDDTFTSGPRTLRTSRFAAEKQVILQTLRHRRWNVSAAARELGISRVGLTRKLKKLGIERPGTSAED